MFLSAPFWRRKFTISTWPRMAAQCRAVLSPCSAGRGVKHASRLDTHSLVSSSAPGRPCSGQRPAPPGTSPSEGGHCGRRAAGACPSSAGEETPHTGGGQQLTRLPRSLLLPRRKRARHTDAPRPPAGCRHPPPGEASRTPGGLRRDGAGGGGDLGGEEPRRCLVARADAATHRCLRRAGAADRRSGRAHSEARPGGWPRAWEGRAEGERGRVTLPLRSGHPQRRRRVTDSR